MPAPDNPNTTCIRPQGDNGAAPPSDRPLVTFMLITYNQERFIREAVEGAFAQTYTPLEIILSDDCSTDRTFEIMKEMAAQYKGPHKIILNRNERNLGICGHVNRCVELTQGELIVCAAGDDISLFNRVENMVKLWQDSNYPICSIFSNYKVINSSNDIIVEKCFSSYQARNGKIILTKYNNTVEEIVTNKDKDIIYNRITGATHAFSRKLFNYYGMLNEDNICEDDAILFRSTLFGNVFYIHSCLVLYRVHDKNTFQWGDTALNDSARWYKTRIDSNIQKLNDLNCAYRKIKLIDVNTYRIITRELKSYILKCKINEMKARRNYIFMHILWVVWLLYMRNKSAIGVYMYNNFPNLWRYITRRRAATK